MNLGLALVVSDAVLEQKTSTTTDEAEIYQAQTKRQVQTQTASKWKICKIYILIDLAYISTSFIKNRYRQLSAHNTHLIIRLILYMSTSIYIRF